MKVVANITPDPIVRMCAGLRELLSFEEQPGFDLREWYKRSKAFQDFVESEPAAASKMEECIWHYLSDADIRARDSKYRTIQRESIAEVLSDLEHAIGPVGSVGKG